MLLLRVCLDLYFVLVGSAVLCYAVACDWLVCMCIFDSVLLVGVGCGQFLHFVLFVFAVCGACTMFVGISKFWFVLRVFWFTCGWWM